MIVKREYLSIDKALLHVSLLLHCYDESVLIKMYLYWGITRVRSEDDVMSEPSESPDIIQDTDEFTHPSVTVAFTFKVSLWSVCPRHTFKTPSGSQ